MSYAMWCGSYRLRHPTSKDVDGMAHGSCSTWSCTVVMVRMNQGSVIRYYRCSLLLVGQKFRRLSNFILQHAGCVTKQFIYLLNQIPQHILVSPLDSNKSSIPPMNQSSVSQMNQSSPAMLISRNPFTG